VENWLGPLRSGRDGGERIPPAGGYFLAHMSLKLRHFAAGVHYDGRVLFGGHIMRLLVRHIVTALLISGLLYAPAEAAAAAAPVKPMGLVVQAELAHLDSADAATGTTVFPGDAIDTQDGGSMRLKVGANQLYLFSDSAAKLAENSEAPRVILVRGMIGISSGGSDQIELETPLGIVRAEKGKSASGQVRIAGPEEIVVSAFRGNMVIDRNGEERTIESGKSYDITLDGTSEPVPASRNGNVVSVKNRHLLLKVIIISAEGITAYLLWRDWSESCYNFKGC
jgi:hypothetical protein